MNNQLRKDLLEMVRTFRLYVIAAIFFAFGISSPLLAKLLPQIAPRSEEFTIIFKETTALSAASQYFDSIQQIGLLLVILFASSVVAGRRSRQQLYILLTKPLRRRDYLLSRFLSHGFLVAAGLVAGHLPFALYTHLLFGGVSTSGVIWSYFASLLFLLLALSLTLLFSTLSRGALLAGVLSLLSFVVISVSLGLPSTTKRWSPGFLIEGSTGLITGARGWTQMVPSLLLTLGLIAIFLILAILCFRRKEL